MKSILVFFAMVFAMTHAVPTNDLVRLSPRELSASTTTGSPVVVRYPRKWANRVITQVEVLNAQIAWGNALINISSTFEKSGLAEAKKLAGTVIDQAYGYQFGTVLFKPTLTKVPQTFRTTRQGALAYFVGDDSAFPNDTGFALKGWRSYEIRNVAIFINGNSATSMGNVVLTDSTGKVTIVDKTWQFVKDRRGKLRIVLHHSSLPFNG
jgi:hypothetical protein